MEIIKRKKRDVHPYVPELEDLYLKGRITRREFLRNATLLGMSVAGASAFLTSCGAPEPEPTEAPEAAAPATAAPPAGGPVRGGTYTASMQLQLLDHPARLSWVEGANIVRQFGEYLTETGPDNVTRPYLAGKVGSQRGRQDLGPLPETGRQVEQRRRLYRRRRDVHLWRVAERGRGFLDVGAACLPAGHAGCGEGG